MHNLSSLHIRSLMSIINQSLCFTEDYPIGRFSQSHWLLTQSAWHLLKCQLNRNWLKSLYFSPSPLMRAARVNRLIYSSYRVDECTTLERYISCSVHCFFTFLTVYLFEGTSYRSCLVLKGLLHRTQVALYNYIWNKDFHSNHIESVKVNIPFLEGRWESPYDTHHHSWGFNEIGLITSTACRVFFL